MALCIYNRDDPCCFECKNCMQSKYYCNDEKIKYNDFKFDYNREEEILRKYEEDEN